MMLVVVYVGAVSIIFLFVVMMLDIDASVLKRGFTTYLPIGAVVGIALAAEVILAVRVSSDMPDVPPMYPTPAGVSNTEALGRILYTDYVFFFQTAGLVLLVAMIGAIVLTLRHRPGVRRQSISAQVSRDPKEAIETLEVKPGEGVS